MIILLKYLDIQNMRESIRNETVEMEYQEKKYLLISSIFIDSCLAGSPVSILHVWINVDEWVKSHYSSLVNKSSFI